MLNKLLERLNGHGGDAESLTQAMAQLRRDRESARASVKDLQERRRRALLDDVSDEALDRLEREIARAESRVEKLALAEPLLRERLNTARAAADKVTDDATVSEYVRLSEIFAEALEAADSAAAVQRMWWNGNERVLSRLGIEPLGAVLILGNGYGIQWAQHTREVIAKIRRRLSGQPAASPQKPPQPLPSSALRERTRLPHERARLADTKSTVTLSDAAPGWHSAAREPDDLAPLEPGEARVKVMRHGYSPADDRPGCSYLQVVRMPLGPAARAADRGAVVIVEVYGETLPPAEGAAASLPPDDVRS
jgi:hypothetical protein